MYTTFCSSIYLSMYICIAFTSGLLQTTLLRKHGCAHVPSRPHFQYFEYLSPELGFLGHMMFLFFTF